MSELEKDIQKRILERLAFVRDGFFWRENAGMTVSEYKGKKRVWRSGFAGIADVIGVYRGIFVAIEVKRPGKKPTELQSAFLDKVRQKGGIAFVCDDDAGVVQTIKNEFAKLFPE